MQTRDVGLAANMELRLPTGKEEQFLGAGSTAFHASAIASVEGRRIGSHFKAGFVTGGVSDEVNFGAAIVLAATSRFNVVGEIFGRRLSELARITEVTAPHPLDAQCGDDSSAAGDDRREYRARARRLQVEFCRDLAVERERAVPADQQRPDRPAHALDRPRLHLRSGSNRSRKNQVDPSLHAVMRMGRASRKS